jgi:hypothetical protein
MQRDAKSRASGLDCIRSIAGVAVNSQMKRLAVGLMPGPGHITAGNKIGHRFRLGLERNVRRAVFSSHDWQPAVLDL